jgi:arylsulfatase K
MTTFLLFAMALLTISHTAEASPDKTKRKRPNIVLLVCESTDGRTWREGYQNNVIPLPNLRSLEEGGYAFHCHYSNTPVCCPSRATLWSGRHAHKIPHIQRQSHTNRTTGETKIKQLAVDGVWNNFEGLPHDFDERIDQVLQRKAGYATRMSGKLDFTTGGHSENVKLSAWTMYTRFPYHAHSFSLQFTYHQRLG